MVGGHLIHGAGPHRFRHAFLVVALSAFTASSAPSGDQSEKPAVQAATGENGFWDRALSFLEYPLNFFLPHYERRTQVFRKETQYHVVTVEDDESGRRHLVFSPGKGSQSMYCLENPDRILSNYMRHALALSLMASADDPERVLFIGMGGGIMPTYIRKALPNAAIDIVELDPEIPKIAERFFNFDTDRNTRIIIQDARVFVNERPAVYDLIFVDAYNGEYIPFHLTTIEFYRSLKEMLAPDGVLAVNIANFENYEFIKREFKTIDDAFENVAIFICPNATNYVPIAGGDIDLSSHALRQRGEALRKTRPSFNFDFETILDARMSQDKWKRWLEQGEILTDDHAPTSLLR